MNVLDLFSGGAGGWTLGLHRAGFRTVAACEIDEWRRAIFTEQWRVPVCEDVRKLTAAWFRESERPFLVCGSPPSAPGRQEAMMPDYHDDACECSRCCGVAPDIGLDEEPPMIDRALLARARKVQKSLLEYERQRARLRGASDCTCMFHSRESERAYEQGICPHQIARALLAEITPAEAAAPDDGWNAAIEAAANAVHSAGARYTTTHDMAQAIRALRRAAPDDGWRDIASAPKDGTHILAFRVPIGIRFTSLTNPPTVVHWFDDPDEPGFYTSVNELAPEHSFNPTYWRPLPPPPAERKE